VVYGATADQAPVSGDDALDAVVFPEDKLPQPLAFDHRRIIEDFLRREKERSV